MASSVSSHHNVDVIGGMSVRFPFAPYEGQICIMNSVLDCILQGHHGLIESPTGSGKTLALLCSALAWQENERSIRPKEIQMTGGKANGGRNHQTGKNLLSDRIQVPIIIYASRTHSQLSQAVRALKSTSYRSVKSVVLGSRDIMCIHEEVSRVENSSAKNNICHAKVRARSCAYYNNVAKRRDDPLLPPIADIEDIVKKGRMARFCPFFMSRELAKDADIVFMPYNYLLDPKLRSSQGIEIKNAIIILDEGHNIIKVCEDAVSFDLRSSLVATCIQEVTKVLIEYSELGFDDKPLHEDLKKQDLINMKKSLLLLEQELDSIQVNADLLPARVLLDPFISSGFARHRLGSVVTCLDAIATFLAESSRDSCGCDKLGSILRVISAQSDQIKFSDSYKVFVEREDVHGKYGSKNTNPAKVFHCWCLNPGLGLETLLSQQPKCILLCSGTLAPMAHLEEELITPFPVQMSAPHVIGEHQLFTTVLRTGPENIRLSSNFENRNDPKYLFELGQVVVRICSVVPKGVLIFFPSYSTLGLCTKAWKENGIYTELENYKKVYIEPQRKDTLTQVMESYYSSVKVGHGACLMAVCRGKVSEGLDFADDNGRAVIITGIPYPPAKDPRVMAKQEYLNKVSLSLQRSGKPNCLNGKLWYQLEGSRALSQAVGRIIRHVNDYGAIIFCDERCSYPDFQQRISSWIFRNQRKCSSFEKTLEELAEFFGSSTQKIRMCQTRLVKPKMPTTFPVVQDISEPISETDLYGDEEYSSTKGRKKRENLQSMSAIGELWNTPTNSNKLLTSSGYQYKEREEHSIPGSGIERAFNSPLPVFTKSFAAFSKTDAGSSKDAKKRKIKLTKTNSAFPLFEN